MARTAVIAGVGPGLGSSLARRFAGEGCDVALFARSGDYIAELADDLPGDGAALAVPTDLADVDAIQDGFAAVRDALGPVDVLVNHASYAAWQGLLEISPEDFERSWLVNGRGAFHCTREAVGDMVDGDGSGGTVIFTGATSAVRSRGGAIGFTAAKFAARGIAMDVAQQYGSEGVHVAHVVIDGKIDTPAVSEESPDRDDDAFVDPDRLAETYWHLVEQDDVGTQPFEVHVTNGPGTSEFI